MPSANGKVEHRQEISHRLCLSRGIVSGLLWAEAIDGHQPVGTCTACSDLMLPLPPEEIGPRLVYPARCRGCGREVQGVGPRPAKKGAER